MAENYSEISELQKAEIIARAYCLYYQTHELYEVEIIKLLYREVIRQREYISELESVKKLSKEFVISIEKILNIGGK